MPKAARLNNTPRRTASLRKTSPAGSTHPIADPIFAAIAAHRASVETTDRNERLLAARRDGDWRPTHAALVAEHAAAKAMVDTAPRTRAGLRALERHLRDDAGNGALHFIQPDVTIDELAHICGLCKRDGISLSEVTKRWVVDGFIAKRAAEIAAEG
jgi:hypothetical protein